MAQTTYPADTSAGRNDKTRTAASQPPVVKPKAAREITKDEFMKRQAEAFEKADANHDGKLGSAEKLAYHEKAKAERRTRWDHKWQERGARREQHLDKHPRHEKDRARYEEHLERTQAAHEAQQTKLH